MTEETAGYVEPEQPVSDGFFSRTFGSLIAENLQKRALNDAKFRDAIVHEAFHLEEPLVSQHVYGTGERTFDLNLYGRKLTFWNTDAGSYDRGFEPINYTVPFLIIVHEERTEGIFIDNTFRGTVDIGYTHPDRLIFQFEGPARGIYRYHAETVAEIVAQFVTQTGKMPLPPLWALGYHQCRYSYMTHHEVLSVAREFRLRQIPCDVIYLDIHYMDAYKVFTWDKSSFPDFARMVQELHDMHFKLVCILDPGVKVEPGYIGYESGRIQDVFLKNPDGAIAEGVVWPGLTHHPDFSNAPVRQWWAACLKPLIEAGVDGLWNDMNEPLYFGIGEAISPPDYLVHNTDEGVQYHIERHNLYGHDMSRASRLALETHRPNKRPFNITRSGYAGTQAIASSWTGDNKSTWDDLRLCIPMNLNMGLAGQAFTGPDIGGFATDTNPELLIRWMQACCLFPFFRNHSAVDTIYQEPWQFGKPTEHLIRQAITLRYQLMPYLYTQFALCHRDGLPIMRPLFTAEPHNPHLRDIDDSFLLGDHVLVAPILSAHSLRRTVVLPGGSRWFSLDRTQVFDGGHLVSVEAPLNTVPIFVRAGTALPMWEPREHLDQLPDTVRVRVFQETGTTLLYEDAGEGLNPQSRWTTLHNSDGIVQMTVHGDYPGATLVFE